MTSTAGPSACGTSPPPSRCLVSARTRSDREPSTRNTVVSGPTRPDLCPTTGVAGVRAALATALAADRRDRSGLTSDGEPTREAHRSAATENSPTGTLQERLRLGAWCGGSRPDTNPAGPVGARTAPSRAEHDQVEFEVSLKDTDGADQKVTLQAWLAGRAHLVATSHERDLDHALAEVRRELIRQIEEERSRREPRKRRKTRKRTT